MTLLSRYMLRSLAGPFFLTLAVVLVALVLERMLRIVDLVTNKGAPLSTAFELIGYLLPHYLGLALPAALFLGVLIAVRHLWTGSEITALWAAGIGVTRLLPVLLGLATVLVAIDLINVSFVQPHSRYAYRAAVHELSQQTLSFGLQEGVFEQKDEGIVIRAEQIEDRGRRLIHFFGRQERNGRIVTMTAREATLFRAAEGEDLVVRLSDGTLVRQEQGELPTAFSFASYDWVLPIGKPEPYGARGRDERELTLPELVAARDAPPANATVDRVAAELHMRLAEALSMFALALLAVPLALLGAGRAGRAYGLVVGLFLVVLYQKLLGFGESFVSVGSLSPWLAIWLPFAGFAGLSIVLLVYAGMGIRPIRRRRQVPAGAPPAPGALKLQR